MYLLRGVLSAFSSPHTHTDKYGESGKVWSQTTMGEKMKWCNAQCLEWSRPNIYVCEKLCWILFSIVRFSLSVDGVGAACEHFACHLLHWECGRLKIGTNITSRTYVYLFVTSIQCSIQLLYINQAAACILFSTNRQGGEREDTSIQSEHLTYSLPLMYREKKKTREEENEFKRKWRNCAATNLNFPFDEKKILSCCKRLRINYIV